MINLEIVITLVAMLIAFFIVIYLLQKGSVRKRRIKQDFETLELAKQLKCDTREPENLSSLGLKSLNFKIEKFSAIDTECKLAIAFGLIIFIAFLGWSVYLIGKQFIILASLSSVFALLCLSLLIYAKNKLLRGKSEVWQIRHAVDKYEQSLISAQIRKDVKQSKVSPSVYIKPINELYEFAQGYSCVPQDSTLKRHFLSNLMAEVESSFSSRPTDSTLKRHYDAMINTAFEQRLQAKSASVKFVKPLMVKQTVTVKQPVPVTTIPEDSMLRRHVLAILRNEIEDSYAPKPTDSTLKRHFDAMVDSELEQRVEALSANSIQKISESNQIVVESSSVQDTHEHIPEDSMLKRHFLTQLREKIEEKLPPRPTDFNLLRHYKAMIQAKLERDLEEHYS